MIQEQIIQTVNDAIEFQSSELCSQLRNSRHPPHYWKWVRIYSHRRAGYTTAAITLLEQYPTSLIVTPSHSIVRYVYDMSLQKGLYRCVPGVNLLAESELDDKWFCEQGSSDRRQLIILDPAGMIEDKRGNEMDMFRDRLFMNCDVLVELS